MGDEIDGTTQALRGMNVYAYDYFHPYDYMSGKLNCTDNTYSIHWFNGGWLDDAKRKANEQTARDYERIYRQSLSNCKTQPQS